MFNPAATIILTCIVILAIVVVWWLLQPSPRAYVEYSETPPDWNYSIDTFHMVEPFDRTALRADAQSSAWQDLMQRAGRKMAEHQVKCVVFVHGTFVGHDPLGIVAAVQNFYPSMPKLLINAINRSIKSGASTLLRDNGNFTREYVSIYQDALNQSIPCIDFHWSSENHHWARVKGTLNLLDQLAQFIEKNNLSGVDRILLQGHSHAGQLFALLAMLAAGDAAAYSIIATAQDAGYPSRKIWSQLSILNRITLDYVTFGTPPIYNWPNRGYYRLMNLINHRGTSTTAGRLRGVLTTADGDYVQQFGILGTDIYAASPQERAINKKLDAILGEGNNLKQWHSQIKKKMRVPPFGRTLLINYRDDSDSPNFLKTFFGHGVYTRYETMLFHTLLIAQYYYKLRLPKH